MIGKSEPFVRVIKTFDEGKMDKPAGFPTNPAIPPAIEKERRTLSLGTILWRNELTHTASKRELVSWGIFRYIPLIRIQSQSSQRI